MSLVRYNPNRGLSLFDAMDRLMNRNLRGWDWPVEEGLIASMPIDVYSTDDEVVITATVPGVKPDDIEIKVEGEKLTISGKVQSAVEDEKYLIRERFQGEFSRSLSLNIPVDSDKVKADFENGILTVHLPKAEASKPRTIKVQAKK